MYKESDGRKSSMSSFLFVKIESLYTIYCVVCYHMFHTFNLPPSIIFLKEQGKNYDILNSLRENDLFFFVL